jgi:hypothetical protein
MFKIFLLTLCLNELSLARPCYYDDGNNDNNNNNNNNNNNVDSIDIASTIQQRHMVGYQGWFQCGEDKENYIHWFEDGHPVFDMWPELSDYDQNDLCETSYEFEDGSNAKLFSAQSPSVVYKHFEIMQANTIDGVFLQQFTVDIDALPEERIKVAENVRNAAETYGRTWAIMFDISGSSNDELSEERWEEIYGMFEEHIQSSSAYLHEDGKPVIAIWGIAFDDEKHPATPEQGMLMIDFFKNRGFYILGGVPTDFTGNDAWHETLQQLDVISPWNVGAYHMDDMESLKSNAQHDREVCDSWNVEYMPVIFPGFSWLNLNGGELNEIPREGGKFYMELAKAIFEGANPSMMYTAMFDEVNEGTAIMPVVAKKENLPTSGEWVSLDIDGSDVPSDLYVQLAGKVTDALRNGNLVSSTDHTGTGEGNEKEEEDYYNQNEYHLSDTYTNHQMSSD